MNAKEVKNIKATNSYVLVRVAHENNVIRFGKSCSLTIDPSLDPAKHVPVYGTVVSVPDKLLYAKDKYRNFLPLNAMEWKTDVEIKEGDTVYFIYLAMIVSMGSRIQDRLDIHEQTKMFLEFDDDPGAIYVFLLYSDLYFAIRGQEVVMLNGYVMVEHIQKELHDIPYLAHTEEEEFLKDKRIGKVVYVGSACSEHFGSKKVDALDVQEGAVIIFRRFADIYFESSMHSTFRDGANYYCIQRKNILASVK